MALKQALPLRDTIFALVLCLFIGDRLWSLYVLAPLGPDSPLVLKRLFLWR
jgi:hypothetical protein